MQSYHLPCDDFFTFSWEWDPGWRSQEYCADLYAWYLSCIQVKWTENFNSQIFHPGDGIWLDTSTQCPLKKPLWWAQVTVSLVCISSLYPVQLPSFSGRGAGSVVTWVAWFMRCNVTSECNRSKEILQNILTSFSVSGLLPNHRPPLPEGHIPKKPKLNRWIVLSFHISLFQE